MEPPRTIPGTGVAELHQALVDQLLAVRSAVGRPRLIRSPAVEAAFRAVPRHLFLPEAPVEQVYRDEAIITKRQDGVPISSSSQPAIMAIMLEQLALEPGHRVLEIGAGTGYNAALMAHIVGNTGQVVTVDIDQDTVDNARAHLAAAGYEHVRVVCADGGFGYPEAAPYDRIILTVGAWDIAPAWREQLIPGGRLVLPLSIHSQQQSIAFEHVADHLRSVSIAWCGFMVLRGAFAAPQTRVQLGSEPGLWLASEDQGRHTPDAIHELLLGPGRDRSLPFRATQAELFEGLVSWLAWHDRRFCSLSAEGGLSKEGIVPFLFGMPGKFRVTSGLAGDGGLCVLTLPPELVPSVDVAETPAPPPDEPPSEPQQIELLLRSFGPDDTLAEQLIEHADAWDRAGRPTLKNQHIRAYPLQSAYIPTPNEAVLDKRWTRLVWEQQS